VFLAATADRRQDKCRPHCTRELTGNIGANFVHISPNAWPNSGNHAASPSAAHCTHCPDCLWHDASDNSTPSCMNRACGATFSASHQDRNAIGRSNTGCHSTIRSKHRVSGDRWRSKALITTAVKHGTLMDLPHANHF
jgi:ribosomal protein S27AE